MAQALPHRHYVAVCRGYGLDCITMDADEPGVCVVAVGSGLMQVTVDRLVAEGWPVCCAVDVGSVPPLAMAHVADWACCAAGHTAVLAHTWHSRSSAAAFGRAVAEEFPTALPGRARVPVVYRLAGLEADGVPPCLDNHATFDAALATLARLLPPFEARAAWYRRLEID